MAESQEELPTGEADVPPSSPAKRAADDELDGPSQKQPRVEDPPEPEPEGDSNTGLEATASEPPPAKSAEQPKATGATAPGLIGAAMLRQPHEPARASTALVPPLAPLGSNGKDEEPGGSTFAIPRGLMGVVMRPPVVDGAVVAAGEPPTGACAKGSFNMASFLGKGCGKGIFGGSSPAMSSPPTSLSFEIPAKRVKDILGVKGTNIKALKQLSRIQKIDLQDRSDPATVTVHGSQEACEKAKHMVLSIAAGDQSVIGNIVETIDVDQRLVSKLIGAKGAAINQIKDASGCYLEVRETGNGNPPRVIMTGPRDAVERAKDLVMRFLIEQTAAVNQQAAVAATAAGVAGLPGLGDPLAALGIDAQAQLQAQLLLQAQLAQLSQVGIPPAGAAGLQMPGGLPPPLPPELALQLQQQTQGFQLPQPPQQDPFALQQALMQQQAQLTQGMQQVPGMGGMGLDPNALPGV